MIAHLRRLMIRRRLERTLKPCPEYRARRLAHLSPERRARYLRNIESIQQEIGIADAPR